MEQIQVGRIAIVGVGLLGGLLLERMLNAGLCAQDQIIACEARPERRAEIAARYGVAVTDDNRRAAAADAILLAVPPPAVMPVLQEMSSLLRPGQLVVSLAAAVPLAALEAVVGEKVAVMRALPNSPALVGQGVTPVAYGRTMPPAARALAQALLSCWGEAVEVPDGTMNACVGVAAAAPTYLFPVIEALAEAGTQSGLPPDVALRIAAAVVRGSGAAVLESGRSPQALAALTPLQPLRADEAKTLFVEAANLARSKMEALQARLGF